MSCSDYVKHFPANTGCLMLDGNQGTIGKKDRYLGGAVSPFHTSTEKVDILMKSDLELKTFSEWWVNDLDFGIYPFRITLPFFGVDKEYVVRMTNDLTYQTTNEKGFYKIPLQLELAD